MGGADLLTSGFHGRVGETVGTTSIIVLAREQLASAPTGFTLSNGSELVSNPTWTLSLGILGSGPNSPSAGQRPAGAQGITGSGPDSPSIGQGPTGTPDTCMGCTEFVSPSAA